MMGVGPGFAVLVDGLSNPIDPLRSLIWADLRSFEIFYETRKYFRTLSLFKPLVTRVYC